MMSLKTGFLFASSLSILSLACTKNIIVPLPKVDNLLVVDAQLSTVSDTQKIKLSTSQPYFEQTPKPPKVVDAVVQIRNSRGPIYTFTYEPKQDVYSWIPSSPNEKLGELGDTDTLIIDWRGQRYIASSPLLRVPTIDKVMEDKDKDNLGGIIFEANDLQGTGDLYLIKALVTTVNPNTKSLRQNQGIVYDIVFSQGSAPGLTKDGGLLEKKVRTLSKGTLGQDIRKDGVSVTVMIYSIPPIMTAFYNAIQSQKQRAQAGETGAAFSSFFTAPPFNVPTNIKNQNPQGSKALGFFVVSNASQKALVKP